MGRENRKECSFATEVKLNMVEWAKPWLFEGDFRRIRQKIRKDDSITQDQVTAMIEESKERQKAHDLSR